MTASTITLINPFSSATVERNTADIDAQAVAALLDDATLAALEGADTDAEWLVSYVEYVGAEEAGRVILGS
ncbi:MAG: hypothetical protein RL260_1920 [Pseudomonadota bacterium]|jgi:hypothetical protein